MVRDPLHRLDCCVVTDGGGAVVHGQSRRSRAICRGAKVKILGHGEAPKHTNNGRIDLTYTGAAGLDRAPSKRPASRPSDIDYASIYDSFTITVVETIEDLGFCEKGKGGAVRGRRRRCSRRTASCRSTPMAAGCATTIRPIAAA